MSPRALQAFPGMRHWLDEDTDELWTLELFADSWRWYHQRTRRSTRRGNTELPVCGWLVLEPPRYMVKALRTVYEIACFLASSLDDLVPIIMQNKFQQFVPVAEWRSVSSRCFWLQFCSAHFALGKLKVFLELHVADTSDDGQQFSPLSRVRCLGVLEEYPWLDSGYITLDTRAASVLKLCEEFRRFSTGNYQHVEIWTLLPRVPRIRNHSTSAMPGSTVDTFSPGCLRAFRPFLREGELGHEVHSVWYVFDSTQIGCDAETRTHSVNCAGVRRDSTAQFLGVVLTCPVLCNGWCRVWSIQCSNRGGAADAVYRQPPTSLLRRRGTPGDSFHCCEHAATSFQQLFSAQIVQKTVFFHKCSSEVVDT